MTDAVVHDIDEGLDLHAPRVRASFRLTSERHLLDGLRDELAIDGALSWQKGDPDDSRGQQRRMHGWSLTLPDAPSYSADTALSELLLALAPKREEIVQAIRSMELDARVCIEVSMKAGHPPVLHCTPATIGAIASYGAAVSVQFDEHP